ncbi:HD domain-containing protein [Paenibacillus puerhi]|uniref:HD domain-containing protein n=1 Tax=Paenibacillus puerhi TaxID=2692622 RepID=UPI00135B013D|nr:HD domain-containing protein [Paenibacillus puerhi]
MNRSGIILAEARTFAREVLGGDSSGHDWQHTARVARTACELAQREGADAFICEFAAILHDVADEKLNPSKEAGLLKVESWLSEQRVEESIRLHVMAIIGNMSYSDGQSGTLPTLEGRIVQDADRLDALGAVGIARTFAYSGWKGQLIFDPELPPREKMSKEQYRHEKSTAINHFYEKLLKLKDLMNTEAARELAEERHRYMEAFLAQFYRELGLVRE